VATTVTLDSKIVEAVKSATNEKSKASAVRVALQEFLRVRKLRELAGLAGAVDLKYSNEEIEAMEEC